MIRKGVWVLLLISIVPDIRAQEIPIGEWRLHVSYDQIIDIDFLDSRVFAASEMGLAVFDRQDQSFSSLNKLNGLTGSGITAIGAVPVSNQLIVGYEDSNIDLVTTDGFENYTILRDLNTITGSKRINDITIHSSLAYLSTDYGVVVFDFNAREVKETWRNLGTGGSETRIFNSAILGDSIALATDQGVLIGDLKSNLLDYNFWKRYNSGDLAGGAAFVQWFDQKLYAAIDTKGLYRKNGNVFEALAMLVGHSFNALENSLSSLVISTSNSVWKYNSTLLQVSDERIVTPLVAKLDDAGSLWVGDSINALVSDFSGSFNIYKPNGPSRNANYRLSFFEGSIFAVAGGFTPAGIPFDNPGTISVFQNGLWEAKSFDLKDVTDAKGIGGNEYFSSFQDGLYQINTDGSTTVYNNSNTPLLENETTGGISISALHVGNGLWISNYDTSTPLQLLKTDNTWQTYSPGLTEARYLTDLVTDDFNNVWAIINPFNGGGLLFFNPENNETKRFTETAGSGGLPNRSVISLAKDREGYLWVGTEQGVGYFYSESADAIRPIFENRFLLKDEKINAIAVDGGNRKWMGTERGVWLFSSTGEELIYNFNEENSPLLSDIVRDIAINEQTGEVFFATEKGIASFRSGATSATEKFETIKIFPNPVTARFSGQVGIAGLAKDAIVKITDVSGKLLWQGVASGGTATWNVSDYNGRRAETGVYLVFASSVDGKESAVGKIVVIE
jgi:hypothetical protein